MNTTSLQTGYRNQPFLWLQVVVFSLNLLMAFWPCMIHFISFDLGVGSLTPFSYCTSFLFMERAYFDRSSAAIVFIEYFGLLWWSVEIICSWLIVLPPWLASLDWDSLLEYSDCMLIADFILYVTLQGKAHHDALWFNQWISRIGFLLLEIFFAALNFFLLCISLTYLNNGACLLHIQDLSIISFLNS